MTTTTMDLRGLLVAMLQAVFAFKEKPTSAPPPTTATFVVHIPASLPNAHYLFGELRDGVMKTFKDPDRQTKQSGILDGGVTREQDVTNHWILEFSSKRTVNRLSVFAYVGDYSSSLNRFMREHCNLHVRFIALK